MTVTHVGTTKRYAAGWESIFGKQPRQSKKAGRGKSATASPRTMKKKGSKSRPASGKKKAARGKSRGR